MADAANQLYVYIYTSCCAATRSTGSYHAARLSTDYQIRRAFAQVYIRPEDLFSRKS